MITTSNNATTAAVDINALTWVNRWVLLAVILATLASLAVTLYIISIRDKQRVVERIRPIYGRSVESSPSITTKIPTFPVNSGMSSGNGGNRDTDEIQNFMNWFDGARFKTHWIREGYDLDEVDDFLDEVRKRITEILGG